MSQRIWTPRSKSANRYGPPLTKSLRVAKQLPAFNRRRLEYLCSNHLAQNFVLPCYAFPLYRAMSGGKETSFCAAALLLCTVLALPAATGETKKIQSACALQCTRKVSLGKTEAKCTLPADTHDLKCFCQQLLNISQNVSSL